MPALEPSWVIPARTAAGGLLAAAILFCGCADSSGGGSPPAAVPPEGQTEEEEPIAVGLDSVAREPLSAVYATSATLRADKQARVTARTHGVIRRLLVEEGDYVKQGQPLAYLEDEEEAIGFERASTMHETKRREHERAQRLHEQGLMSEEDYETIRRDAQETKHAAALAELQLARTVIRAPFEGQILTRYLDVGTTVNDGAAVYELADLAPLYADVGVPERQVERLAPGQRVRLYADSSSEPAPARIERIAPAVDPETGTVKVTLAVDAGIELRPGSFVRAEIVTETHPRALVVPRSALVADGRRWHVFRVKPEGDRVERLEVRRGFEEQDRIEILASGERALEPGDRVVVVGASALTEDSRIEVVDPDEADDHGGEESAIGDARVTP